MAKLNEGFFDKIAAKVIEKGEPDDLAKFMLSGKEPIEAVQRYFNDLEADKKKVLNMVEDKWILGYLNNDEEDKKTKAYTGLPLFKFIAPSIIPFVELLYIDKTKLDDYSFLNDIKNLDCLWLEFADEEHIKVFSALSSLQFVNLFHLNIKGLTLQFLSSLRFSFDHLIARRFIFEADPNCDNIFPPTFVYLYGDEEVKNDFVFNHQNYQNYAKNFPNAEEFSFEFYIKIVDDVSELLKVSNPDYEVNVYDRTLLIQYQFFDYSGFPESKVLRMLQQNKKWDTLGCPYTHAGYMFNAYCSFPFAILDVANRLAKKSLHRVPESSNGNPEEYYRWIIENKGWGHKAEFEILKTTSIESLLEAYGEITGIDPQNLCFRLKNRSRIFNGAIVDELHDNGIVEVEVIKNRDEYYI